ncbi:hypothetical protein GCM10023185_38230 [Hymenobacter saemangeumensis]|uniref:Late embryogenesis abundant protein LEA-2 subgroup domain-containing protein n=1 Tax=Hymenobacter saemangeumensis TaxID=1084522 RepID=A0ABP8IQG0_9BACT
MFAAYALSKKGDGLKKLEYEVVGVQVHKFSLPLNLDLRVSVRFLNTSSQSYKVNSIRLNVKEGGDLVGDCFANEEFTIAPGTQTTVKFPLSLRGAVVLRKLVPLLSSGKPLPALDVQGFITAEGIETPLEGIQVPLAPYDPRNSSTAPVTTKAPAKPTPTKAPVKPAPKAPAKPAAKAPVKPAAKKTARPAGKAPARPAGKAPARTSRLDEYKQILNRTPAPKAPARPAAKAAPKKSTRPAPKKQPSTSAPR